MPDLKVLTAKLENARRELHNLQIMQMRPEQSAQKLEHLRNLEESVRAEIKLRQKALFHRQGQERGRGQASRVASAPGV